MGVRDARYGDTLWLCLSVRDLSHRTAIMLKGLAMRFCNAFFGLVSVYSRRTTVKFEVTKSVLLLAVGVALEILSCRVPRAFLEVGETQTVTVTPACMSLIN